jgi:hypothetical protein
MLLAELQATHKIDWYRVPGGQRFGAFALRRCKTGPTPTDRRKLGSKHHLLIDAKGVSLWPLPALAQVILEGGDVDVASYFVAESERQITGVT